MVAGLSLASAGIGGNLIVYLIKEFNIKSINAAQIVNVVVGSSNLLPILAAILADSFFGSFSVAFTTSCVALLVNYIKLYLYIHIYASIFHSPKKIMQAFSFVFCLVYLFVRFARFSDEVFPLGFFWEAFAE
jgi:hypothetical protein